VTDIAGRFELRERIGGGIATDVYRALDRELGDDVVLRLVRSDVLNEGYVERFHREAEAASDIRHPNVAGVIDHGVIDGRPFLTRELVEGETLEDLLARRGSLPEDDARSIAEQIAHGVGAAHARGLLHRDINAGNVFVTPDGTAKVVDFGMPTAPRHPAPEQADGRTIDERADVYGLGAVLYQMLTGHVPSGGPVRPRRLAKRVSKTIDAVVMRALERDPAQRFASAAALVDALRAPEPALMRPTLVPPLAPTERIRRPARRTPGQRRAAGFALLLLGLPMVLAVIVGALPLLRPGARDTAVLSATTTPRATATSDVPAPPRTTLLPPVETTPEPSLEPTAPPTVPPAPAPAAPPPPQPPAAVAPVPPNTAAGTVRSFYELIEQRRFDDAAALWSPRMQANYPPSTNIYGRFDRTRQIVIRSITPVPQNTGGAAVAIDILEELDSGVTRRWIGQWHLIWDGSRWLMDAPNLRPG
jgi:serine/threonine protein kinase